MKQLRFLFEKLGKGETHIIQCEDGSYLSDIFKEGDGLERHSIESRIIFELFGEYPLSKSRVPQWELIKSAIKL